jgi:hypothetical protein
MGHNFREHNLMGHNCREHNFMGYNRREHDHMEHNCRGHGCVEHNYRQHESMEHNSSVHKRMEHNCREHILMESNCMELQQVEKATGMMKNCPDMSPVLQHVRRRITASKRGANGLLAGRVGQSHSRSMGARNRSNYRS